MSHCLLPAIASRFSCRSFVAGDKLSREEINLILQSGQRTPSGCNKQPWRFIVCQREDSIRNVTDASFGQEFVSDAPCIIVVFGASEVRTPEYKTSRLTELAEAGVIDRASLEGVIKYAIGNPTSEADVIRDCAMAVYSMMLQASHLGRASCWISVEKEKIKEVFKLTDDAVVICALAIGTSANDIPDPRPRLGLDSISYEEDITCQWR